LQQKLIEVIPDSERARGDTAHAKLARLVDEHLDVGEPFVGQSIGQHHGTVDDPGADVIRDLIAASEPAEAQIGLSAGPHFLDVRERGVRVLRRDLERGRDDLDFIIVGDDGHHIRRRQMPERVGDGPLDELQLVTLHRPTAIQDEAQIYRQSRFRRVHLGHFECHQSVAFRRSSSG